MRRNFIDCEHQADFLFDFQIDVKCKVTRIFIMLLVVVVV